MYKMQAIRHYTIPLLSLYLEIFSVDKSVL